MARRCQRAAAERDEGGMDKLVSGATVEITGRVITQRHGTITSLLPINYSRPVKALVLGRSTRYTGTVMGGYSTYDEYEPGYLVPAKSHPVWVVMPLSGNRYRKPVAILEEQVQP